MALALIANNSIDVQVFLDERSAAFAALGHALHTKSPAVVLCTSGTAAAHFHGAIIEADLSCIPLLVCTADRPPELWDVGAPQTINQTDLYGATVRGFYQPGPPEDGDATTWRSLAHDSYRDTIGHRPGPVHLNLSFRDPLVGLPRSLPSAKDAPWAPLPEPGRPSSSEIAVSGLAASQLLAKCLNADGTARRGVILAGRGQSRPEAVIEFADKLGWPILADHRSGCRVPGRSIRHFDSLLRNPNFARSHQPEVIVRLGETLASKAVSQWVGATKAAIVSGVPWGRRINPEAVAPAYLPEINLMTAANQALRSNVIASPEVIAWNDSWTRSDQLANQAIRQILETSHQTSEPEIARSCLHSVPPGGALVVSSSMPVRDLEWYGENRNDLAVYANRGANGIDGVISTAIGIALTGVPTICLIGDVAFLHDSTALIGLRDRQIDLTIAVTDNDGGGIFSFLPQKELLESDQYEQLFGTPHGTDLAELLQAHGLQSFSWDGRGDLIVSGLRVMVAKSNRQTNQELHENLRAAVDQHLDAG